MISLNAAETASRLPYAALVPAIAHAARELASNALQAPERLALAIGHEASLLCMPAVGPDIGITKLVTVHPHNASLGLPTIQGEVIVFDVNTGKRLLLLDGPTVTARRTAAVTLLAIEKLSSSPPRTALVIGTGAQALAHVQALFEYFDIRSFWIAGKQLQSALQFCQQLREWRPEIQVVPTTTAILPPSGPGADVVIAVTTSKVPVVPAQLPDATLAIGVGAFRPEMAELPPGLIQRRSVVVDYLKGAQHEAGDLQQARVNWAEVSEIAAHLDPSDADSCGPYVFKSVGHASWDLAAARVAMRSG